jgi:hypothetical protein
MKAKDVLLQQLDRLDRALHVSVVGREREWSDSVAAVLDATAEALRQHREATESPDGLAAEVDLTRLSRQVGELCQEHRDLGRQLAALRDEVRQAAAAFAPDAGLARLDAMPLPGKEGPAVDFSALRERAEALLAALRRHVDTEAGLVLESINTDLGTGD